MWQYVVVNLSVCHVSVSLSVTFVRPSQPVEIFGNVSTLFGTLAICWHPGKILGDRRRLGKPLGREEKGKHKNLKISKVQILGSCLTYVVARPSVVCPRETPPSGELNTRGVAQYSDFGPIERYISWNGAR